MHIFWQVPHFMKIFLGFTILAWTRWFSRIPQFSTIFSLTFRSSSYRHKVIGEVLPRLRFLITNITIFDNCCRHVTSNVNSKYSCYLNNCFFVPTRIPSFEHFFLHWWFLIVTWNFDSLPQFSQKKQVTSNPWGLPTHSDTFYHFPTLSM